MQQEPIYDIEVIDTDYVFRDGYPETMAEREFVILYGRSKCGHKVKMSITVKDFHDIIHNHKEMWTC